MHYYTKLAKKLMEEDRYTCVICGEGITYFSEESGVRPPDAVDGGKNQCKRVLRCR